jgi:hypothetical protein
MCQRKQRLKLLTEEVGMVGDSGAKKTFSDAPPDRCA